MDSILKHEIRRAVAIQGAWTLAYLLVLAAAVAIAFGMPQLGAWRSAIMLLPLVPAFGILRFTLRQFQRTDEMLRLHQLVAIAWAFGIMLALMISYALLEAVGWPRLPMWVMLCVAQAIWTACILVQVMRFR